MMDESGSREISDFSLNFLLGILNFFSSRSASFIVPVKGEGFIDFFFGLLDFPGRNVIMLQGSS
jgi:hypothetical protein